MEYDIENVEHLKRIDKEQEQILLELIKRQEKVTHFTRIILAHDLHKKITTERYSTIPLLGGVLDVNIFFTKHVLFSTVKRLLKKYDYESNRNELIIFSPFFEKLPKTYNDTVDKAHIEMADYIDTLNKDSDLISLGEFKFLPPSININYQEAKYFFQKEIDNYAHKQKEKKEYLPPLSNLFVNNVLYLANHIHGSTEYKDKTKLKTVKIPRKFELYRLMVTSFGYVGICTIQNFIHIRDRMIEHINKHFKPEQPNVYEFVGIENKENKENKELKKQNKIKTEKHKVKIIKNILKMSYEDAICRNKSHATELETYVESPIANVNYSHKCTIPRIHHFTEDRNIVF
uniref:Uncharacterized protein n=1 Tax=viral metagenome TaxID=1070528 RepID=A0A6C0EY26_9ZZZZ